MPVHSLYEFAVLRLIEKDLPPFEPWTLEDLGELPSPVAKKEVH